MRSTVWPPFTSDLHVSVVGRPLQVLKSPGRFALQVLKGFRANQGLLLAGAVAYYALLSIVPLLILTVIALSHVVDQVVLLQTVRRYLEWLVPGQSGAITTELANFMAHREVLGWVLLVSMLFFSSLAFTVLENAMSVIFHHRVLVRRRHLLVSAIISYAYIPVSYTHLRAPETVLVLVCRILLETKK